MSSWIHWLAFVLGLGVAMWGWGMFVDSDTWLELVKGVMIWCLGVAVATLAYGEARKPQ